MNKIASYVKSLIKGLRNFIAPSLFTVAIFIGVAGEIFGDWQVERDWTFNLMLAGALGFGISYYFSSLSLANNFSERRRWLLNAFALALSVTTFFVVDHTIDFHILAVAGLSITFVVLGVYQFFTKNNKRLFFSQLLVAIVQAGAMALVFTAGVLITIAAVHFLLAEIEKFGELMSSIGSFGFIVFFPVALLALLPQHESMKPSPRVLKVLIYYVLFPTFLALIVVLYLYMARILITWDLPSGQINWFVSYAALAFIIFSLILPQYESRPIELFKRFGGLLMIPLIIVQLIMIYIRYEAYGLTPSRWASLICIAIAITFVVASLFKSMDMVYKGVLAIVVGSIILAVGPLNLFEVPAWEQSARMERILIANNMLEGDKIQAQPELVKAEQEKIFSAFIELERYRELGGVVHIPEWLPERSSFATAFGFEFNESYYWDDIDGETDVWYAYHSFSDVNVEGATEVIFVRGGIENPRLSIEGYGELRVDGTLFNITEELSRLPRNEVQDDSLFIVELSNKYVLYIESASVELNPTPGSYNDLSGFIIVKE